MTWRDIPVIPTIVVLAAVAVMIALGVWQLGRADEKEALLARYEAVAEGGLQFIKPSRPEAAYTEVIVYCRDPENGAAVAGRNANGQTGYVHRYRCWIGGAWPATIESVREWEALFAHDTGAEGRMSDAQAEEMARDMEDARLPDYVVEPADIVLGWSRSPEPVDWEGGWLRGTVVPFGELGFKIVADPPLAGLEANAAPDPNDIPNNHLAYAGQWFFFALTALVIYFFALRSRVRAKRKGDGGQE